MCGYLGHLVKCCGTKDEQCHTFVFSTVFRDWCKNPEGHDMYLCARNHHYVTYMPEALESTAPLGGICPRCHARRLATDKASLNGFTKAKMKNSNIVNANRHILDTMKYCGKEGWATPEMLELPPVKTDNWVFLQAGDAVEAPKTPGMGQIAEEQEGDEAWVEISLC
ncbi:uncharacterized protein J7T54_000743 [Emericellopsis cladophorae]|uniref:Uncharacterized protein n=1 Tax=Emericellopsis cladophorae TaxID=2686198 RepID=A0A9P9XWN0_9HYPO|nr:uncharacterized protein J7T54_000743 [Emericellopsis cladophorae]KAI6778709.1 hypothetical protein J7T54_000743 [Emericellopsis cladophorae]